MVFARLACAGTTVGTPTRQSNLTDFIATSPYAEWFKPFVEVLAYVQHTPFFGKSAEIADVLKTPEVAQRLASLGTEPVGDSPESFRRFVTSEIEKWTRVAEAANVKLD